MIYFHYNFFDRAKEPNINEIKLGRIRSRILTCLFIYFFFKIYFQKKEHGFIEEDNPSEKVVVIGYR